MNRHTKRNILLYTIIILCVFFGSYPVYAAKKDKIPKPVEWKNPLPRIKDLGLDYEMITRLCGDRGQFIFCRDPQPLTCWTKEGDKTFPAENIVSSIRVVNAPIEKVIATFKDYNLIETIQKQHSNVKFVSQEGNQTLYSYEQIYKMAIL